MRVNNKYILVINDENECIIHSYFKTARIETQHQIIATDELNELDINLAPILENIEDQEINKIYNYQGNLVCEMT